MSRCGAALLAITLTIAGCNAYDRDALDSGPHDPDTGALDDAEAVTDVSAVIAPDTGEDPFDAQIEPFDAGFDPPDARPSIDAGASADASTDASSDARPPVSATFQVGVAPTTAYRGAADTQLFENQPTTNYGSLDSLRCDGDQPNGSGKDADFLVRWDVTSIPPRSVVRAATLEFYVLDVSGTTFPLYELRRAWNSQQATWNRASSATAWSTGGALGTNDRGSTVLGTFAPMAVGRVAAPLNAAGLALVKRWVDQPSTNFGVLVISNTTNGLGVASSETTSAAQRPRLTISYVPP